MTIPFLRKVFSFLGVFFCLNASRCQTLRMESIPTSGPWASDGQLILFTDTKAPPIDYSWEGPNGFTAHDTTLIKGLVAGTYCVTVTVANSQKHILCKYLTYSCPDIPIGIQIQQPTPGAMDGSLALQLPPEGKAVFYQKWNTGDTNRVLRSLDEGYYHLTIIDNYGCNYFPGIHLFEKEIKAAKIENTYRIPPTTALAKVVHSGVRPATSFGAVRELVITALYPNPFRNQLFVEIFHPENTWITIELQDSYHRLVYKDLRYALVGENRFKLQYPDNMPGGLYILSITDNMGHAQYQKLIHLPRSAIP